MINSIIVIFSITILVMFSFQLSSFSQETESPNMNMGSMMGMCQEMMNSIPQDVVMKTISGQVTKIGVESKIILQVTDKIGNPLDDAVVILHIEKGAPMESMKNMNMMDMMGRMFEAENTGDGKYLVKFTPEEEGYFTMHTHAIPAGKSMMSMMNNHMDIGLIAI